jgi:WD40 repeat protein
LHRPGDVSRVSKPQAADWVYVPPRRGSSIALYAVASSSDGRYLAAGGGDKRVHVWDLRTAQYLQVQHPTGQHSPVQVTYDVSTDPVASLMVCCEAGFMRMNFEAY